jgi:sugar phosphate isomerase/epimerase
MIAVARGMGATLLAALGLLFGVPGSGAEPRTNAFFALCMDTHDAKRRNLQQQAELLKELGFDGAGHLWLNRVPDRLKTLDAAGLKLFQVYIRLSVSADSKQPIEPDLKDLLPSLKGRDTMLAPLLVGAKPSDESRDERAVEVLRELADLAKPYGVRIALYHHTGNWLERVEDAIRVSGKVDRENVGIMFNLCHWLRVDKERNYRPLLQKAMPRLFAVSINGADELDPQPGWSHYIQPLDHGSFDIARFLRTLRELGYAGPVGLQCYGLGGDAREHLARSIQAWKKLQEPVTR